MEIRRTTILLEACNNDIPLQLGSPSDGQLEITHDFSTTYRSKAP